jgi:hypothetical protein
MTTAPLLGSACERSAWFEITTSDHASGARFS